MSDAERIAAASIAHAGSGPAIDIQCFCGAVKVRLSGKPMAQFYCHCDDCQAAHCAAYLPVAMYRVAATELLAGDVFTWKRRETPRTTCRACGTRVFAEPPGMGVRGVSAFLLPQGMFVPEFHIQCQHALLPLRDDLPHFLGFPAAFGGSDAKADW